MIYNHTKTWYTVVYPTYLICHLLFNLDTVFLSYCVNLVPNPTALISTVKVSSKLQTKEGPIVSMRSVGSTEPL